MQYSTKTKKLVLTKRETETLANAAGILADAGRIIGDEAIQQVADAVQVAADKLVPKEETAA